MSEIQLRPLAGQDSDGPPEGWDLVPLPEVCQINPPKPPADHLPPEALVTFVPMPAVDADAGAITKPQERPLSAVRKGFTPFANGDVIMAKITPCMENGKAAIASNLRNGLGFGSTEFHVLRPTEAVLAEYLYYFIRQESFRKEAEAEMTGSVGQKRVPAGFLDLATLPVPPVAEQRRIVKQIQNILQHTTQSRTRLFVVPEILKRFRQSVLAAACSGRLTAGWREHASDVKDPAGLLADILTLRRTRWEHNNTGRYAAPVAPEDPDQYEYPSSWTMASMDQITCLITSGSRGWAEYYSEDGPLFIRAQNINTDQLVLDDIAHVRPPGGAEGRRTRVQLGDLLVTITGANVTKAGFVHTDLGEAYVSQHVALVRPVDVRLQPFMHLWTISPSHGRKKLTKDAYGAGKPGLNLDNIRCLPIALPPIAEQHEIVRRVNALFKLADTVEVRVAAATAWAEKLTQAILAKAFRGELVPTEAELARREGRDYEPASVLLERIRADRAAAADKPKLRRGRLAPLAEPQTSAATPKPPAPDRAVDVDHDHDHDDGEPTIRPSRASRHDRRGHPDGSDGTAVVPIGQTDRDEVMAVIREVFGTGGARTRDEAIHQVAEAMGYGRVGSRIREILDNDIRTAVIRGILQNENGQLSLLVRQIDEYDRDHLVNMLLAGMGRTWWDRDEIIKWTARWLGFRRTGPLIQKTLKTTISTAIRRGLLESGGDTVRRL